jgi:hypothetical protein
VELVDLAVIVPFAKHTPDAQREAWYQAFHLLPLAEQLLDGNRQQIELYLTHFYEHWAGRNRITPGELEFVVAAYARPGAFVSSIWWYRARAVRRSRPAAPIPVDTRTIALWGDRDPMRPLDHRGIRARLPRVGESASHRCRALRSSRGPRRSRAGDRRPSVDHSHVGTACWLR